ncbi:MAG: SRPBCC family protein [Bacteroidetes bacterium]|nr:SRPBCC family protein [Bacteroidota bacterium]
MKILKYLGIALLILIVAIVIGMFIVPTEMRIEKSIQIKASKEVIWSNLKYFRNFAKWSPWQELDPQLKATFTGTDGEVGATYEWKGNKDVGSGKMKFTKIEDQKRAEIELKFGDYDGVSNTFYTLEETENGEVKVTWGMVSPMSRPMNVMGIFMKGMIEKDYEKGLKKLKDVCEKENAEAKPEGANMNVQEMDWKEVNYLAIRKKIPAQEVGSFFGENFGKAYAAIAKAGQKPGIPSGLVYMWDETTKTTDIAAAVECPKEMKALPGFEKINIKGSKAVYVDYYGSYEKTGLAHNAINAYLKENKLEANLPSIEQYITDPMSEKDTAKWLTKVIYLVK